MCLFRVNKIRPGQIIYNEEEETSNEFSILFLTHPSQKSGIYTYIYMYGLRRLNDDAYRHSFKNK